MWPSPLRRPKDTSVAILGSPGMMLGEAAIETGSPSSVELRSLQNGRGQGAAFVHLRQGGCIS